MTWSVVARRDWPLTLGTRSTKLLLGLLVAALLLAGYVYPVAGTAPITTARFPRFAGGLLTTLVPVVGVLVSYDAVASERESGSLLLSLALPHSRRDVVVGKWVSRTALVTAAVLLASVGAGALVVYPFGELTPWRYLGFVLLTVCFGAVWTGVGLAVSLAASTRRRALVAGFALVFLFAVAWDAAADALVVGLHAAGLVSRDVPGAVRFLVALEPGHVFDRLTTAFVDPTGTLEGPWYLDRWVALALFVLWGTVPVGLAASRFDGSDLT